MHPNNEHKTAFTSLFDIRVLLFGLCNDQATLKKLMAFVLAGLLGTSCLVYLDDILIFSRTFDEHTDGSVHKTLSGRFEAEAYKVLPIQTINQVFGPCCLKAATDPISHSSMLYTKICRKGIRSA